MKRFITFKHDHYDAMGGMGDFHGFCDTFAEAKKKGRELLAGPRGNRVHFDIFDTTKPTKYYEMYSCDKGGYENIPYVPFDAQSIEPRQQGGQKWVSKMVIVENWTEIRE